MLRYIRAELGKVRASHWIVLALLLSGTAFITWRFIGLPAQHNRTPGLVDLLSWAFWIAVLAIVAIWGCWKKTDRGWRWRWRRS